MDRSTTPCTLEDHRTKETTFELSEELEEMDNAKAREIATDSWRFLVIEDIGEAAQALQARGIKHTRLSHFEVLTHFGQHCFTQLHERKFTHLWLSVARKRHDRAREQKHHSQQS